MVRKLKNVLDISLSDANLVSQISAGDEGAFVLLMRRFNQYGRHRCASAACEAYSDDDEIRHFVRILQIRYVSGQALHGVVLALASALLMGSPWISAEAKPGRHTVIIEALQYAPRSIEVNVGDTVIWTDKDAFPRTVTADNRAFNSAEVHSGGRWEWKAQTKGIFPYGCTFHPTMRATLIVK